MQSPRHTKVGHRLKYSSFVMLLEASRHGEQRDITFLKLNLSIDYSNRGLS